MLNLRRTERPRHVAIEMESGFLVFEPEFPRSKVVAVHCFLQGEGQLLGLAKVIHEFTRLEMDVF
jgi:hypothetical protein